MPRRALLSGAPRACSGLPQRRETTPCGRRSEAAAALWCLTMAGDSPAPFGPASQPVLLEVGARAWDRSFMHRARRPMSHAPRSAGLPGRARAQYASSCLRRPEPRAHRRVAHTGRAAEDGARSTAAPPHRRTAAPPHRRTAAPPLPCTCELAHDLKPNLCRRASSTRLSWGRRSKPKPRCCP